MAVKKYDLIILANHSPSKWAKDTVHEYLGSKGFLEFNLYRVTNRFTMKDFKKQFKFVDLPCLLVTEKIASNRSRKTHYYGDDIEKACKEAAKEGIRREGKQRQRESRASIRLRLHNTKEKILTGDVLPAAPDNTDDSKLVSDVLSGKRKRTKKTTSNV